MARRVQISFANVVMYRHTGISYSLNISGVKVFVDSWFKHFCNKYSADCVKII